MLLCYAAVSASAAAHPPSFLQAVHVRGRDCSGRGEGRDAIAIRGGSWSNCKKESRKAEGSRDGGAPAEGRRC